MSKQTQCFDEWFLCLRGHLQARYNIPMSVQCDADHIKQNYYNKGLKYLEAAKAIMETKMLVPDKTM